MAEFEKLLDDFSFHLANMAGIAHATNPATRQRIEAEMESSRKALLAHVAAIEESVRLGQLDLRLCQDGKATLWEKVAALESELARVQPQAVQASAAIASLAEELAKAREALTALVQWDQRHPKSFVMGEGGLRNCEAELDAIVEKAKSALPPGGDDGTK